MSYYGINAARTMKMMEAWVNPDYDGRAKYGSRSVKRIEEGELIEVWDRADDPDDIRFYLKPHKEFTYGGAGDGCPEFCGRQARSIATLAVPVEDTLISVFLRIREKSHLIWRLVERGILTVSELKRMCLALEQAEEAEMEATV